MATKLSSRGGKTPARGKCPQMKPCLCKTESWPWLGMDLTTCYASTHYWSDLGCPYQGMWWDWQWLILSAPYSAPGLGLVQGLNSLKWWQGSLILATRRHDHNWSIQFVAPCPFVHLSMFMCVFMCTTAMETTTNLYRADESKHGSTVSMATILVYRLVVSLSFGVLVSLTLVPYTEPCQCGTRVFWPL